MGRFVVIEIDDGLTVVELDQTTSVEAAAEKNGGVVVDTTIYSSYDDAYDALLLAQAEDDDVSPEGV